MLTRFTVPGRYDVAPFGTLCKVMGEDETFKLWLQVSEEENVYHWIQSGEFFEKLYNKQLESDDEWRTKMTLLYKLKNNGLGSFFPSYTKID